MVRIFQKQDCCWFAHYNCNANARLKSFITVLKQDLYTSLIENASEYGIIWLPSR